MKETVPVLDVLGLFFTEEVKHRSLSPEKPEWVRKGNSISFYNSPPYLTGGYRRRKTTRPSVVDRCWRILYDSVLTGRVVRSYGLGVFGTLTCFTVHNISEWFKLVLNNTSSSLVYNLSGLSSVLRLVTPTFTFNPVAEALWPTDMDPFDSYACGTHGGVEGEGARGKVVTKNTWGCCLRGKRRVVSEGG